MMYVAAIIIIGSFWYAIKRGVLFGFLRALTLGLILAAYINPQIEESTAPQTSILLVDQSKSVSEEFRSQALKQISELGINPSTYYFGKNVTDSKNNVDASQTNLAQSLSYASSRAGGVILISDGFETEGSSLTDIQGKSIPIFPIIPGGISQLPAKFTISQFDIPLKVREGKGVAIRVVASNGTKQDKAGEIRISQDGEEISREKINLSAGSDIVTKSTTKSLEKDLTTIKASLFEGDSLVYEEEKTISKTKDSRVLLIESSPEESRLISKLPVFSTIDSVLPSALTKEQIVNSKSIILNNVKASELGNERLELIKKQVKSGSSLLMVGGNKSFGLGEYINSPIEEILPVKLIPPQKEEKRLNVAVQLVLDKSKSMAEDQRLQQAKEAAVQVMRNLKDDDYIGVIGFDRVHFPVIPIAQLRNNRDAMIDKLLRLLRPWGTTQLLPALNAAKESLEGVKAGRKHVIVLTDGELTQDSRISLIEMVKMMRFSGITVSTVLIGPDFDTALRPMAEAGGGAYYNTPDPSILPKIFLRDIYVRAGERNLKESEEYLVYTGSSPITLTSIREFPSLLGFTKTEKKDSANLEMLVGGSEEKSPLLAWNNVDAGKAFAFTSDFSGRWTKNWGISQPTTSFFDDLIRSLKPKESSFDFEASYKVDGESLRLEAIITQGNSPEGIETEVKLPSGSTVNLSLSQVAPGRFEGIIPEIIAGEYTAKFNPPGDSINFKISKDIFGEVEGKGIKIGLLEQLALRTGGKINPSKEDIQKIIGENKIFRKFRYEFLWAALCIWILEIFLREMPRKRKIYSLT